MAIDLKAGGRINKSGRTESSSTNDYRRMLIRTYEFLARRTESDFNKVIAKRLIKSRTVLRPISLSRLSNEFQGNEGKTVVFVGTVVDDERLITLPQMTVVALRFTKSAAARIQAAGGKVMTFDQLAQENPTGKNTLLIRGQLKNRRAEKYFGRAPGLPGSHTRPREAYRGQKKLKGVWNV